MSSRIVVGCGRPLAGFACADYGRATLRQTQVGERMAGPRNASFGRGPPIVASCLLCRIQCENIDVDPRRLCHDVEDGGCDILALELLHLA